MVNELNAAQRKALVALSLDPGAHVEAGTLGFLRRCNLVGKAVEKPSAVNMYRQKTTSPLTEAGMALLAGT